MQYSTLEMRFPATRLALKPPTSGSRSSQDSFLGAEVARSVAGRTGSCQIEGVFRQRLGWMYADSTVDVRRLGDVGLASIESMVLHTIGGWRLRLLRQSCTALRRERRGVQACSRCSGKWAFRQVWHCHKILRRPNRSHLPEGWGVSVIWR